MRMLVEFTPWRENTSSRLAMALTVGATGGRMGAFRGATVIYRSRGRIRAVLWDEGRDLPALGERLEEKLAGDLRTRSVVREGDLIRFRVAVDDEDRVNPLAPARDGVVTILHDENGWTVLHELSFEVPWLAWLLMPIAGAAMFTLASRFMPDMRYVMVRVALEEIAVGIQ